jgi:hypothetical protein
VVQSSSQQAKASSASEPAGVVTVEARIKDLHNRLHITAAQKPQWDNLTQVMRENAQAMVDLEKQRAADANSMSAVDVVKSYQSVIEAHEDGMKKFIPPRPFITPCRMRRRRPPTPCFAAVKRPRPQNRLQRANEAGLDPATERHYASIAQIEKEIAP